TFSHPASGRALAQIRDDFRAVGAEQFDSDRNAVDDPDIPLEIAGNLVMFGLDDVAMLADCLLAEILYLNGQQGSLVGIEKLGRADEVRVPQGCRKHELRQLLVLSVNR